MALQEGQRDRQRTIRQLAHRKVCEAGAGNLTIAVSLLDAMQGTRRRAAISAGPKDRIRSEGMRPTVRVSRNVELEPITSGATRTVPRAVFQAKPSADAKGNRSNRLA